ncbi:MAG: hypothetical protein D8H97_36050 [Neisseria sp.]|jgi:hypothetical protein|nr:MAG: hypothetical protein D8H97_36050 [Neisseria sp.]
MAEENKLTRITSDDLFVGLALPPTLLGAPYFFTVISIMLAGVLFLMVNNPLMLLVAVPLILIGRLLIRTDPYATQTVWQFMILRTRAARSMASWSGPSNKAISVSPWDYQQRRPHKRRRE